MPAGGGQPIHYGRWVTIGGDSGDGGSHVYIEGGRVTKGHASLVGRSIDALDEDPAAPHRSQWAKEAKNQGINPKHLHQLAADLVAHDKASVDEHNGFLRNVRSVLAGHSGHVKSLHLLAARGKDQIPHLDKVREGLDGPHRQKLDAMVQERPGEHETDIVWDLLTKGNAKPMAEEKAYRQAFEHLWEREQASPVPF